MPAPLAPLDVSALLRPGVYILHRGERVTYVGTAKVLLISLGQQAIRNRERLPAWFPLRAIPFDGISIIPCDPLTARSLAAALIDFHNPLHNRSSKPGHTAPKPIEDEHPSQPSTIAQASLSTPAPTPAPVRRI